MPFHIEEIASEVTVIDGEMPIPPAQIEKLVRLVLKRLEEKQHGAKLTKEACSIERHVSPALRVGD